MWCQTTITIVVIMESWRMRFDVYLCCWNELLRKEGKKKKKEGNIDLPSLKKNCVTQKPSQRENPSIPSKLTHCPCSGSNFLISLMESFIGTDTEAQVTWSLPSMTFLHFLQQASSYTCSLGQSEISGHVSEKPITLNWNNVRYVWSTELQVTV